MTLVLVRHGATLWSESGRHTGRTDLPLTERGIEQARALVPLLAEFSPGIVLSSPLLRARTTAELAGFGGRLTLDPDLLEWNYGDYEGLTTAEIRKSRPEWDLFTEGAPGGESPREAFDRASRVADRLRSSPHDALVFAHGHILRLLVVAWLGLPPERARHFVLKTATLTLLGREHEWPALLAMNSLSPPAH
ncbi:MAG: histidine phosphatase family protein [Leptospirillia bacterium]